MFKVISFFLLFSIATHAQKIKDFSLNIYGQEKTFSLAKEAKGYKKVLINFWASWCTGCIQELPELEALKKSVNKKDILFIAVNAGEKRKKIKRFLKKYKFSYLILEDKDRVVSKSLDVKDLPKTIVIDNKMNILFKGDRPPKKI